MQSPFAKTKNRPKKMTSNHCRHPNSILFELVHFSSSRHWSLCSSRWYVSFLTSCRYVFPVFRSIPIALYRHRYMCWMKFYCVYRLAANTISLLIMAEASSIFSPSFGSPITRAAFLTSRHVSSNRWIHRTIIPEGKITKSTTNSNRTKLGVLVLAENDRINHFKFL